MTLCGGKADRDRNREVGDEAPPVRNRPTINRTCGDCLQSRPTIALCMLFPPDAQRHGGSLSHHGHLAIARLLLIIGMCRKQEDERRALAQFALHPDPTAVCLNDVSCNGQSQTCAALVLALMMWALVKFIEDMLDLPQGNTCTRIRDADLNPSVSPRLPLLFLERSGHPDDAPIRGKFHRIIQQIVQYLLHPLLIKREQGQGGGTGDL